MPIFTENQQKKPLELSAERKKEIDEAIGSSKKRRKTPAAVAILKPTNFNPEIAKDSLIAYYQKHNLSLSDIIYFNNEQDFYSCIKIIKKIREDGYLDIVFMRDDFFERKVVSLDKRSRR